MERIQCPCCYNFTIESDDEAIVEFCEVCAWQYDWVAHDKPDISIGANHLSLSDARKNYVKYGVSKLHHKDWVRKPLAEELPENNLK